MTPKERQDFLYAEYLYYFDPTPQYAYDDYDTPLDISAFVAEILEEEMAYD